MTDLNFPMSRRSLLRATLSGVALAPLVALAPMRAHVWAESGASPLPVDEFDAGVVTAWTDEILAVIRATPGYSPPVAARAIGYTGVALYESLVPGIRERRSLRGVVSGLPGLIHPAADTAYAWPVVASAALAEITRLLFPTAPPERQIAINQLEAAQLATAPRAMQVRSVKRGRDVARAIFEWSQSDGGHEGFRRNVDPTYLPPRGPGLWEPTPPAFLPPLQPRWGSNRTFIGYGHGAQPGPPPSYSTDPGSVCFAEANDVRVTVESLSMEQRVIAEFWADDPGRTATPAGHSLSIFSQLARQQDISLAAAAEGFARLGMALSDAFVMCWRAKYLYNLLRPITYIRQVIEPGWGNPLPVTTPPFPEYTSGHSVQSGAAAAVLSSLLGPVAFVDRTHEPRGLGAREFPSVEAAASEAAISRLYGGIHFRSAIERGLEQGGCIGGQVARLPLRV
ncbi:MAG TPA: phosphatase PAP2 family protein [Candidatus Limnocylindria bacterium]|nr:phosphatase PAP2 family protein [Candidatus Limnocylindria bacterium]